MPTISRRLGRIIGEGSDGWDLYRRARAMRARGIAIADLTIGEHDVGTDPLILDAMHAAARGGRTGYAEIVGTLALRTAVAERVKRITGVLTGPGDVLITPGGQGALFAAHLAACGSGDRALYIDPHYATYPGTIRGVDAVPVPVAAHAEDGFQPREADLDAAAAGARSVLVNSPNNPTGVIYTEATLTGLACVARAHDLWVISDEVYDAQVWEGRHLSPRALPGMAERTLVVGSLSKSHAMTGSRLGWIVGPEGAIARLGDLSTVTSYGIPGFIQDAGAYALGLGPAFEARVAAPFARRRAITRRLLGAQAVVGLVPQDGAMYAMLDVRAAGPSGEAFALALLEEERIAVMPGESFGTAAAGHVRVAMTMEDGAYEEALARLLRFAARLAAGDRRAAS